MSWVPQVWSYVEQNALSSQYNLNLGWHQSPNCGASSLNSLVATPLSLYYCPSDRGTAYRKNDASWRIRGNYVVCWGQHAFQNASNYNGNQGIFGFEDWRSRDKPLRTTLVKITDGTSNTLLMSELIMHPVDGDGTATNSDFRGDIMNDDAAGPVFMTEQTPNSGIDLAKNCDTTATGAPPCTPATTFTYNPGTGNQTGYRAQNFARSKHTGGVNVVLADGSVRFVNNSITLNAWIALGTAAKGDIIDGNGF